MILYFFFTKSALIRMPVALVPFPAVPRGPALAWPEEQRVWRRPQEPIVVFARVALSSYRQHGKTRLDVFCDVALANHVVICCRWSGDQRDILHVKKIIRTGESLFCVDCFGHVCDQQCLGMQLWFCLDSCRRIFTFVE